MLRIEVIVASILAATAIAAAMWSNENGLLPLVAVMLFLSHSVTFILGRLYEVNKYG